MEYEYDNTVEEGIILEQSAAPGESVVSGSEITLVISKGSRMIQVPELTGKTEAQAIAALKNAGLTYVRKTEAGSSAVPEGSITKCEPAAGTEVTEGAAVTIYVNVLAAVTEAIMPDLVGSTTEPAVTALYKKGITSVSINEVVSERTSAKVGESNTWTAEATGGVGVVGAVIGEGQIARGVLVEDGVAGRRHVVPDGVDVVRVVLGEGVEIEVGLVRVADEVVAVTRHA